MRFSFGETDGHLQRQGMAPGSQTQRALEGDNPPVSVCHYRLQVQAVAIRVSLNQVPHSGVRDKPRHVQHVRASLTDLTQTTTWVTLNEHHGSKLHHVSYQTHPATPQAWQLWGLYQPEGGSTTMKVPGRGEMPSHLTGVVDGLEIAGAGTQDNVLKPQIGGSKTPQPQSKLQTKLGH